MNSRNQKPSGAKIRHQQFRQPTGLVRQFKPVVAQLKNAVSAESVKEPVAPPVYRPQVKPMAAQAKLAGAAQMKTHPVAPPAYHSPPVTKVLQTKARAAASSHPQAYRPTPQAPPAYRPQPVPKVLQAKMNHVQTIPGGAALNHKPAVAPPVYRPRSSSHLRGAMNGGNPAQRKVQSPAGTRPLQSNNAVNSLQMKRPAPPLVTQYDLRREDNQSGPGRTPATPVMSGHDPARQPLASSRNGQSFATHGAVQRYSRGGGGTVIQPLIIKVRQKAVKLSTEQVYERTEIDDMAVVLKQRGHGDIVEIDDDYEINEGSETYIVSHGNVDRLAGYKAEEIAEKLKSKIKGNPKALKLMSCSVGADNGFASNLKRILGEASLNVTVRATDGKLLYTQKTKVIYKHELQEESSIFDKWLSSDRQWLDDLSAAVIKHLFVEYETYVEKLNTFMDKPKQPKWQDYTSLVSAFGLGQFAKNGKYDLGSPLNPDSIAAFAKDIHAKIEKTNQSSTFANMADKVAGAAKSGPFKVAVDQAKQSMEQRGQLLWRDRAEWLRQNMGLSEQNMTDKQGEDYLKKIIVRDQAKGIVPV